MSSKEHSFLLWNRERPASRCIYGFDSLAHELSAGLLCRRRVCASPPGVDADIPPDVCGISGRKREPREHGGVEHPQPVELAGWATVVVADHAHGLSDTLPPGRGADDRELARTANRNAGPIRTQPRQPVHAFVHVPYRDAKPAGERPFCDQCVVVGLAAVDHVGDHRPIARRDTLQSPGPLVIGRPIRDRTASSPRTESPVVDGE